MSCIYGYWMDTLLVACHCPATPLQLSEHNNNNNNNIGLFSFRVH